MMRFFVHFHPRCSRVVSSFGRVCTTYGRGRLDGGRRRESSRKDSKEIGEMLIVWHSRTGQAEEMSEAMEASALRVIEELHEDVDGGDDRLRVRRLRAKETTSEDILRARGYVFCAPENLASTSGEMLEFFHRCYYDIFDTVGEPGTASYEETSNIIGRPYGIAVAAGSDGTQAAKQMTRIATGWRLSPVCDPVVVRNGLIQTAHNILSEKSCPVDGLKRCEEVGGLVAATLLL